MTIITNQIRQKFLEHIYDKIHNRITGASEDKVYGDKPQNKFFVGTLCSQDPSKSLGKVQTKVSPIRMGVEFLIKKSDVDKCSLEINPSTSVYYKIFPTRKEQLKSLISRLKINIDNIEDELKKKIDELKERNESFKGDMLLPVFKKKEVNINTLSCKLKDFVNDKYEGSIEFPTEEILDTIISECRDDIQIYRPKKTSRAEYGERVPLNVLLDDSSFSEYISKWAEGDKEIPLSWKFRIIVEVKPFNDICVKVSVIFENISKEKEGNHTDNFLFNTGLKINVKDTKIQDYIIDYLNDYYRYDGNVEASGINCEAIKKSDENIIYTEVMPYYKQYRLKTNDPLKFKFDDLATDKSVLFLEKLLKEMRSYLVAYSLRKEKSNLTYKGKRRFEEDVLAFENEIKRFEYGIDILKKYPLALEAFKLMNKSFFNTSKSPATTKSYDSWRVFQIIFIVMNIPDIVSTQYSEVKSTFETVEVLYFPTGGGKTETYLGLTIFTLFFDRLRGKKFGVSAMIKFPLRLLSLQQIQRIANVLAQAELVRRNNKLISGSDFEEFSLGYFVGDRNTPNKLIEKKSIFGGQDKDLIAPIIEERDRILKKEIEINDESLDSRKYLILSKCPFCGSDKILIDADKSKVRLIHRCMNESCEEILPIYISDNEIYRYLPSFIISTLDKIAICGFQKNFRNILGNVTKKCPIHGYTSSKECVEKAVCREDASKFIKVIPYDPLPSIQIQDELHLVRESLGTFNSHYESFLENLERKSNKKGRSIKILTATATISEYKNQIRHLYCKEGAQFPSQGPSIKESFYSYIDESDLNRLIIGIMPHNKTMIFSILDILKTYHEFIQTYYVNPELLISEVNLGLNAKEVKTLLEDYNLMLSYHLAKNDGDSISNSVRTMTNRDLRQMGFTEIKQRSLTGDVSFNEVRLVLDEITRAQSSQDRINLITATSMISHGVDLDKLNFMIFMGMPRNTAEYIQSSSRVGRAYPGIVFVLFNPTRERDQSYFKFFRKFHEYKDLLVEAVPINRWAKFSINRTLSGIYSATILNYFDPIVSPKMEKSIIMSRSFDKALTENKLNKEDITKFLKESYKVDKDTLGFEFDKIIQEKSDQYTYEISESPGNKFISMILSPQPMNSLRDVDASVDITISSDGQNVLNDIKASRTLDFFEDDDIEENLE